MSDPLTLGRLTATAAQASPDLLAAPVLAALTAFDGRDGVFVAPIDPELGVLRRLRRRAGGVGQLRGGDWQAGR